jgi:quercetin dioxygenase-like cupin family protein
MGIYRLYADAQGHSHIEAQSLESHPALKSPQAAKHVFFQVFPVGQFLDWHPAPRRQYVIILSGELEIGLSDGSLHRFGPGDARLVEDTTGKGHTTRTLSSVPVIAAVIPLAEA